MNEDQSQAAMTVPSLTELLDARRQARAEEKRRQYEADQAAHRKEMDHAWMTLMDQYCAAFSPGLRAALQVQGKIDTELDEWDTEREVWRLHATVNGHTIALARTYYQYHQSYWRITSPEGFQRDLLTDKDDIASNDARLLDMLSEIDQWLEVKRMREAARQDAVRPAPTTPAQYDDLDTLLAAWGGRFRNTGKGQPVTIVWQAASEYDADWDVDVVGLGSGWLYIRDSLGVPHLVPTSAVRRITWRPDEAE